MATTVLLPPSTMTSPFANPAHTYHPSHDSSSCPQCGFHLPDSDTASAEAAEATRRIRDLEAQVKLLNSKAAAAVDKLADYEDEIRYLREAYARTAENLAQSTGPNSGQSSRLSSGTLEGPGPAFAPGTSSAPQQLSRLASLSSFLPGRKRDISANAPVTPRTGMFSQNNVAYGQNTSTLSPPKTPFFNIGGGSNLSAPALPSQPDAVTLTSLQSSLEEERTLRLRAESNLTQTQTELEELTAQLFGQANEMVANERKARAKLEERVKVLEQRDGEKRKRLERLERMMGRIERVRGMVGD
jgi:hypothetical protein